MADPLQTAIEISTRAPGFSESEKPDENDEDGYGIRSLLLCTTLASLYVGTGNLTKFPLLVFQHGGLYFVGFYLLGCLLIAWPLSFFECLIGQVTRKGLTMAFGTYGKAYQAIGWSIALTAISTRFTDDFSIGNSAQMMIPSFNGTAALNCDNPWNDIHCLSLQEQYKCNNSSVYYEHACHEESPPFEIEEAAIQHYKYMHENDFFNTPQFVAMIVCWTIMLLFALLGLQTIMIVLSVIGVISVLLLLLVGCKILSLGSLGTGIGYLWHSSQFFEFFKAQSFAAAIAQLLSSASIGTSCVTCLGSFVKPKDTCFLPSLYAILIDFSVSLFCLLIACGVLGETIVQKDKAAYLFALLNPADYGRGFLPQILASSGNASLWIGILALTKLLLVLPSFLSPIFFVLAVVRDHFANDFVALLKCLAATGSVVFLTSLLLSLPWIHSFFDAITLANPYEMCIRPLFYIALVVIIFIYGKNEWYIDICHHYGELDDFWSCFSPSGSLMFFSWVSLVPMILLLTQVVVILDKLATIPSPSDASVFRFGVPLAYLLIVPAWGIYTLIVTDKECWWKLFYPTSAHPAYERITATYEMTSCKNSWSNEEAAASTTCGTTQQSELTKLPV